MRVALYYERTLKVTSDASFLSDLYFLNESEKHNAIHQNRSHVTFYPKLNQDFPVSIYQSSVEND